MSLHRATISAPSVAVQEAYDGDVEISVIIPVYKGEPFVDELCSRLHTTLSAINSSYEIILVDDRAPDQAWALIENNARSDGRVKGIRLSRNFGQHAAISAGIAHARANWYVVMDCDLQDPPEAIAGLYDHARENPVDVVIAARKSSGLGAGRNLGSAIFNSTLRWASGLEVSSKVGNFRIFSDQVAQAFRQYPEQLRLFPAIMSQLGFEKAFLELDRNERTIGKSSYNILSLARLGVETIIAYSEKPLWIAAFVGFVVSFLSVLFGLYTLITSFWLGVEVPGYASLAILLTFLSGAQVSLVSFVGLYVGHTLSEVKRRPIFIVEQVI